MRTWKAVAGKQVRLASFHFLTGSTAAGGAIADVDLDGSALRNQTGSTGVTRADLQLVSGVTFWWVGVGPWWLMTTWKAVASSGVAFFFCGQALPPLPSMQTRKAMAGDSFDWCVCVCVRDFCARWSCA